MNEGQSLKYIEKKKVITVPRFLP